MATALAVSVGMVASLVGCAWGARWVLARPVVERDGARIINRLAIIVAMVLAAGEVSSLASGLLLPPWPFRVIGIVAVAAVLVGTLPGVLARVRAVGAGLRVVLEDLRGLEEPSTPRLPPRKRDGLVLAGLAGSCAAAVTWASLWAVGPGTALYFNVTRAVMNGATDPLLCQNLPRSSLYTLLVSSLLRVFPSWDLFTTACGVTSVLGGLAASWVFLRVYRRAGARAGWFATGLISAAYLSIADLRVDHDVVTLALGGPITLWLVEMSAGQTRLRTVVLAGAACGAALVNKPAAMLWVAWWMVVLARAPDARRFARYAVGFGGPLVLAATTVAALSLRCGYPVFNWEVLSLLTGSGTVELFREDGAAMDQGTWEWLIGLDTVGIARAVLSRMTFSASGEVVSGAVLTVGAILLSYFGPSILARSPASGRLPASAFVPIAAYFGVTFWYQGDADRPGYMLLTFAMGHYVPFLQTLLRAFRERRSLRPGARRMLALLLASNTAYIALSSLALLVVGTHVARVAMEYGDQRAAQDRARRALMERLAVPGTDVVFRGSTDFLDLPYGGVFRWLNHRHNASVVSEDVIALLEEDPAAASEALALEIGHRGRPVLVVDVRPTSWVEPARRRLMASSDSCVEGVEGLPSPRPGESYVVVTVRPEACAVDARESPRAPGRESD